MSDLSDLSAVMRELERFGEPSLSYCGRDRISGWRCAIQLNIAAPGMTGEIKSEWRHPTPDAAANECLSRVQKAFRTVMVPHVASLESAQ